VFKYTTLQKVVLQENQDASRVNFEILWLHTEKQFAEPERQAESMNRMLSDHSKGTV
jgi:hypothetical protein